MPFPPQDIDVSRTYHAVLSGPAAAPSLAGVFTGGEAFELLLLPYGGGDAVASLSAAWATPPATMDSPVVRLDFAAGDLYAVIPGVYRVRGLINPETDRIPFLDEPIELRAAPGAAVAGPAWAAGEPYASDEAVAVAAPSDYRQAVPEAQRIVEGEDGAIDPADPWTLAPASVDFAAALARPGMIVVLS